ncbi:MAG: hypothetical protein ABJA82_00840 [Myxococcales bacterium]
MSIETPSSFRFVAALVMLCTVGIPALPADAYGEPASRSPSAAASGSAEETLINRGVEFREKGKDQAALESFESAYQLSKGARALAQIALAEQALGRWVEAESHLGQAFLHSDDPWIARNKALLDQSLNDIQGHLGSLELTGGVPGAAISVNGIAAGTLPLPAVLRLSAGSVAVEVRAAGYLPMTRTVTVPVRGLARESVALVAEQPAPIPFTLHPEARPAIAVAAATRGPDMDRSGNEPSETWGRRKTLTLTLSTAAGVSAVVATTFLLVRNSLANDFNNAGCSTADKAPDPKCKDLQDKEHSARTVSVVAFAGAALFGGVAAYLFFKDRDGNHTNVAVDHSRWRLQCLPDFASASVSCRGEF